MGLPRLRRRSRSGYLRSSYFDRLAFATPKVSGWQDRRDAVWLHRNSQRPEQVLKSIQRPLLLIDSPAKNELERRAIRTKVTALHHKSPEFAVKVTRKDKLQCLIGSLETHPNGISPQHCDPRPDLVVHPSQNQTPIRLPQ
jgi:hypothetical protein